MQLGSASLGPEGSAIASLAGSAETEQKPTAGGGESRPDAAANVADPAESFSIAAEPSVETDRPPMPGHQRALPVLQIERARAEAMAAPEIDGKLDDAVWLQARASGGFWNSQQNRPPSDQTEVMSVTDGEHLYFGFRMYESDPDAIQATRTVRDGGFGYDDAITIELDTFFNRRDISEFSVNAAGTQNDEIAGGRSTKIEWKGDWHGAAARTDYGWSAEFAIPFEILNYDEDATQFGLNFQRYQSRTREYTHWADVTPQSLEEEMGQLVNLELPEQVDENAWTFMPFVLAGRNIEGEDGEVDDSLIVGGIDMRYEPRPDMTAVISVNPDFSQIEEAVTDISFSYSEKSVEENRPFFREGEDYFSPEDEDLEYFYSDRIPDFDVGGKSFGRIGRAQFGSLMTSAPDDRIDFVGRTLYELNETNSAIGTIVSSHQEGFENLLTVGRFDGRLPSGLTYSADAAFTDTRQVSEDEIPVGHGTHYQGSVGWRGDYFRTSVGTDSYDVNYFPSNALLDDDLIGTRGAKLSSSYYREMSHPVWRTIEAYAGAEYRETHYGLMQRQQVYIGGSVEFTNDIGVSTFVEEGPYRPLGDERGVFEPELNNDRYASVAVYLNTRSNVYAYGFRYDRGDLGGGPYEYASAYAWWRPMNTLYLKLSAERTRSFGTNDQLVLTSSWDITPEHSLSGRILSYDGESEVRIAYSHRPRDGLDIFAVLDKDSSESGELSLKVVKTF